RRTGPARRRARRGAVPRRVQPRGGARGRRGTRTGAGMTGRFDGHDPRGGHDTAGVPWAGRTLSGTGFDDDTGEADPALAAALAEPDDEEALVAAVAAARL